MIEEEELPIISAPEKTQDEIDLESILVSSDCIEEKQYYGEEFFNLIHYDILSSENDTP